MKVFEHSGGTRPPSLTEQALHDATLRAGRSPLGRVAVVLHLSRLCPPGPRLHHLRIMRALLQDTADWYEGQVFALASGDMVLLCRATPPGIAPAIRAAPSFATDPFAMPDILGRLLRADTPSAASLVTIWPLESAQAELLVYTQACVERMRVHSGITSTKMPQRGLRGAKTVSIDEDFARQTGSLDAIGTLVNAAAISDLMQRQTAILLDPAAPQGAGLRPLFREITFSIGVLEERTASSGHATADPFLFRHLAGRLDQRMLDVLSQESGRGGPLDITRARPGEPGLDEAGLAPVLHLNLTLPGTLSPAFTRFVAACHRAKLPLGVEISLIEASANAKLFADARARIADAGLHLVLDGVSHVALQICRPWALQPDLLKLDWSVRLGDLPDNEQQSIETALAEIGPARVVLHRAETEAALKWGLLRGIRRFQGRHVDSMLGASRIIACPSADGCTLRQCIERAAATGRAGRSGCHNTDLLDAGVPASAAAPYLGGGTGRPSQVIA